MELRLMVVGSSGPSQFLLTNSILGREEFHRDISSISSSRKNTGGLAGRRVAVINGPNIYDKRISQAKRKMELRRSKCLCVPGPHAFLVAFDWEKISHTDMRSPKLMMKLFGRQSLRHCMVLLACDGNPEGAALQDRGLMADWDLLRELIEKFSGHFHAFSKNRRDISQDRELLQKIEWMVASSGRSYYCSRTFQRAENHVKKEEKRLRKQWAAEVEKVWSVLEKRHRGEELRRQSDAYAARVGIEIRDQAEMDNGWLRTSLARGTGMGLVVGSVMGALVGSVEGPGGMVLWGVIGSQ
ncbi:GTPase IMAP family member 7 [Genypterus blacodes]|uniref:GTPase IMAP family member 7 n=1 Tax=Genypterus blacodes TaxID=154954 RepID=UPI003F7682D4